MVKREEHKIYINPIVWDRLKKEAEAKGISLSEFIEGLVMREVWQPNEPTPPIESKPPKYTIRQLVLKGLESMNINRKEAHNFLVLHCKECNKLYLLSRYSTEPWICDNEHKLELLGTANNFL
ncbi:MAG: hypothetical protein QW101_08320 [Ignisphaera sp.]